MSEEGSEPDIKPRRFNVAEVPKADIPAATSIRIRSGLLGRSPFVGNDTFRNLGVPRQIERVGRFIIVHPRRHVYDD
jgi:hypothetical protein